MKVYAIRVKKTKRLLVEDVDFVMHDNGTVTTEEQILRERIFREEVPWLTGRKSDATLKCKHGVTASYPFNLDYRESECEVVLFNLIEVKE